MTYATGQIINHADYNTFATGSSTGAPNNSVANLNTITGTGFGAKGYGQTTPIAPLTSVTTSNLVTATQWNTMFSRVNTIATHQGTSITAMPTVVTGNEIHAISTLSSNISSIFGGFGNASATVAGNTATGTRSTSWSNSLQFQFTVTFGTSNPGDAARYFFNAGGYIQFQFSRSGGTGNPEDLDWTNTCNNCGLLQFGFNSTKRSGGAAGGAGSVTPPVAIGYWQLTTSNQQIQKQYSSGASPYGGANYIQTLVNSNGTVGVNGDVGSILVFTINWVDAAGHVKTVDGTSSVIGTVVLPSSTYLSQSPASWGSPAIAAATPTGS